MLHTRLQRWLNWISATAQRQRRTGKRSAKSSFRPMLECLEDRVTPSVLVNANFGVETQKQDGSFKLSSPPVFLTYWGQYWGGTGTPQATAIRDAAAQVLGSAYLNGTSQYGGDGRAFLNSRSVYDSSNPANPFRGDSAIQDLVAKQIDYGNLPEADTPTHTPIYVVVTPPGIKSNKGNNVGGFNTKDTDTDVGDHDNLPEVWVSTQTKPDGTLDIDQFTLVLSHEVAEIMTDVGGGGFQVNTPPAWAKAGGKGDGQIGDKEGNSYAYRLANGTQVQPYWSRADNGWLVTDGNNQTMNVRAAANAWTNTSKGPNFNVTYDVTVDGDQRPGNPNDFIQVGTAILGGTQVGFVTLGGTTVLQINLNGELFQFDANSVANLYINTGAGNDTVIVNPVPGNPTISIRTGSPGESSNATITAQTALTIVQSPGSNLNITAQAPVTVNGIQGSITIANQSTTTINATSADSVFVTQNSGSGGSNLFIKNAGTVNVGAGNFANITSNVVVSNFFGFTDLTVDDRQGGASRTYAVSASNVSVLGLGTVFYARTRNVDVYTGTGAESVNVWATTGRSLNLHGNSPDTTVFVGNNGSLAGIQSLGISISNRNGDTGVVIDDHNRGGTQTTTIDTGTSSDGQYMQVSRPGTATIYVQRATTTRNVDVYTGTGVVTVNVLATRGRGLNLHGNSANTAVFVGKNGNLDGIQGLQMTISNRIGDTAVVIDDRNRGGTRTATFDTGMSDVPFMQLTDLISGTIYVQRSTTTRNVDVYTGTGVVTANVLGTIGRGLNLRGNSSNTTVNVGKNGKLDGILGLQMTISNVSGDTGVVIDDRNRDGTRTATFDTGMSGVPFMQMTDLISGTIYVQRSTTTRNVDVYTGTGVVTVNVLATRGRGLNLHGNSATTAVFVGENGNLDGIQGLQMTISNLVGDTAVVIDDRNRGGTRTAIFDTGTSSVQYVQLTALIPGTIYLQRTNTRDVDVYTGTGAVTVNVLATWGHGLNLHGNSVNTTVNVGDNSNSLDNIQAPVTVDGSTTLNVNDQGTITDKSYEIHADAVKRFLNLVQGTYDAVVNYANVGTLTINGSGSNGNNVFFVVDTAANTNTTLDGGAGGVNEFVAYSANGLDSLLGPLTTHGRPGTNSFLVYNDDLAPTAHTYTLTTNTVSRSGAASVTFDNLNQVIVYAASVGGNTINVPSLAAGVLDNLGVANGDTVTIGSNQTVAAVLGQVAVLPYDNTSATVVIDDSGNPTPLASLITLSTSPPYGYLISGLIPSGIYLGAGQNTTLNTSLLTGAGDKTFNLQAAPQGVALTLDAGSGTNNLDYTGYAGNVLVDLPLGAATGFSGINHIQNVTGASGGAPGSYNILVGNGGNVLTGGDGRRNLLIAGGTASTLLGGNQDDILIGGTTAYDTEASLASLNAIMAYWSGTADDYATRVANLTSGNGVPLLDATTVTSNGGGNTLNGNAGLDFFFANALRDTLDRDPLAEELVAV